MRTLLNVTKILRKIEFRISGLTDLGDYYNVRLGAKDRWFSMQLV